VPLWFGLLAPAGTPREIVHLLAAAVKRGAHFTPTCRKTSRPGAEPVGSTPEEFRRMLKDEVARWAEVVKISGARRGVAGSALLDRAGGGDGKTEDPRGHAVAGGNGAPPISGSTSAPVVESSAKVETPASPGSRLHRGTYQKGHRECAAPAHGEG